MVYVPNTDAVMFSDSLVAKHLAGKHDQSSHGGGKSSGTSVSSKVTHSILDKVKENGGLSVRLTNGSEPIKGFMVSRKGMGAIVDAKEFLTPLRASSCFQVT